ncbi:MAG: sensor domain-containing diguanylate cyclase [Lachnospiraceae bacterium]|nr:sensor domain-containing diguanylate cyclase [Lachnospiraceae bacterium]
MIRKHIVLFTNILIFAIIMLGFLVFQLNDARYYRKMAESQVANQIELSAININAEITQITSQERVVSQMMANDAFLEKWIRDEPEFAELAANGGHNDEIDDLYSYLKNYQLKFDYDTVFFVSAVTGNYYFQDGFNKTISRDNEFDSWYYNFLKLNKEYDIQVDRDETQDYTVSLFVNCVVKDTYGRIIGVVGVANHLDDLQTDIQYLSEANGTNIYIVNVANAHNSFKGSTEYFKNENEVADIFDVDPAFVTSTAKRTSTSTDGNTCVIVIHNEELNWNIVVGKNVSSLVKTFLERTYRNSRYILVILAAFLTGTGYLLTKLNKKMNILQNTDELTGLYNNRIFRELYNKNIRKYIADGEASLFMLDIDDFKQYNDSRGHLYGNMVLREVADELKGKLVEKGIFARWGGDEFIGFCRITAEELQFILDECNSSLKKNNNDMTVSLSIGITAIKRKLSLEEGIKRADKALYDSKENGKNQSTIYKD